MDKRVFGYLGHDFFYDVPADRPGRDRYRLPQSLDWSAWIQRRGPAWHAVHPGSDLPPQGWKIHVSSTLDNAREILDAVSRYAWRRRLSFKFAPSRAALLMRNGKQAHRGMSGKFITLYPRDDDELETALTDLEDSVGGADGPYILSDLRWRSGPLHVRYGGFELMTVDHDGEAVPAIRRPDGQMVPDERTSSFIVPPWVTPPPFIAAQIAILDESVAAPPELRYRITDALHFSNGGGVYRAVDPERPGERVVLKEARPFAGVSDDGRDAVARLDHEAAHLEALRDDPAVVRIRERFAIGEHRFVALDEIDGVTLSTAVTQRCPMIRARSDVVDYLEYRDWALGVIGQVDQVVGRLHRRSTVHGDLHPNNLMIRPDGTVFLVDFELAHHVDSDGLPGAGAPGFTPPSGRDGAAGDRWSVAAIALSLFIPLTPLLDLDRERAQSMIDAAAAVYFLPEWLTERLRRELAPDPDLPQRSRLAQRAASVASTWPARTEDGLFAIQVMIGTSLDASADFSRADRCYPGDPEQFRDGGFGLAHGAAGVIMAQLACSLEVNPLAVEWLRDAVPVDAALRPGLYDGLAGVGHAVRRLGDSLGADRIRQRVVDIVAHEASTLPSHLYGGLAGVGLYLIDEDPAELELAEQIAHELELRMARGEGFPTGRWHSGKGLMWGPSGVALFAGRLFGLTGDQRHLALMTAALDRDLDDLASADDGSLQINEGWRLMPYLASGSAGVAIALAQALIHTRSDRFRRALDGIQLALQAPFTIESGLFSGRSGIIHTLALLERLGWATPDSSNALDEHVDGLKLHALAHGAGIAFAGSGLLRASADLATGAAGVLTALQAYGSLRLDPTHDGWQRQLPLLLPPVSGDPHRKEVSHDDGIPPQPAAP